MRNVRRLTIEERTEPLIGFSNASPDNVLLILASELAASDEQIGAIFANGRARAVAEAAEPNEEIFFELGRFLLTQLIVSDESNVNKTECLLKDLLDFALEDVFSRRGGVEVV
jgi:hypothetical protein